MKAAKEWVEINHPKALEHHKHMLSDAFRAGYYNGYNAPEPKPDVFCNHHQSHTIDRLRKVEEQIADDYERMSKYATQIENLAGEIVEQHGELKDFKETLPNKFLFANLVDRIDFLEGAVAGLVEKCQKFSEVVDRNFEVLAEAKK